MILTAAMVGFSGYRQSPSRPPTRSRSSPSRAPPPTPLARAARDGAWRRPCIGLGAGGLSGLLGIGGGVLMVPLFTTWVRMPIKEALATSLVCVGVLAIPGMITHALLGHIDWLFALPLSVGVVPGARLGAHLTIRSSERTVRILVGIVLGVIALVYAGGEILAL